MTSEHRGRPFASVIWPARSVFKGGTYGVTGPFPANQILAFARSMDLTAQTSSPPHGC
jgi:hypothetical protein